MSETARLTIQRWGKSLAVRIPAAVDRAACFEAGQEVEVVNAEVGISVKPLNRRTLTLAEKLVLFDPGMHGGEAMTNFVDGEDVR
jgi:antitoxin MazE